MADALHTKKKWRFYFLKNSHINAAIVCGPFLPPTPHPLPHQDENDVYILTKVSDILHAVFRSYKEKVLPWFEQLLQLIVQLIVSPLPGSLFVVSLSK